MDLPNDLLPIIASHLSLADAIRFGSTCKLAQEIVGTRLADTKRLKEEKMSQSAHPDFMYPGDFNKGIVWVKASQWASPKFGLQEARKCFEARQIGGFIEYVDPRHVCIWASNSTADVDETIRKLSLWMQEECDEIVCLYVQSEGCQTSSIPEEREKSFRTRNSFKDEHLKPFRHARHVNIFGCDCVTDDGIMQFTNMDWLNVCDCSSLTGSFAEKLVSDHELRHITWCFSSLSIPHTIVPPMSPLIDHYVQNGALRLDLSLKDIGKSGPIWKLGTPYRCKRRWQYHLTPV
jgi:hypothetical protein